jgi:hypothetical protein
VPFSRPPSAISSALKVRFHHHIFATNLLTNLRNKLVSQRNVAHFVKFVSKFVANKIGFKQTFEDLIKLSKF